MVLRLDLQYVRPGVHRVALGRAAVRTRRGAGHAEVLRRMRRHVTEEEMATAVCMALDPYTRELTYASAGHPPSLLVAGEAGGASRLDQASGPPLGWGGPEAIREIATPLCEGDRIYIVGALSGG